MVQGLGAHILAPPFVMWGAPLPVALSCLPPLHLMTQAGSQGYLKAKHTLLLLVLGDSGTGLFLASPELLPAPEMSLFSHPQSPSLPGPSWLSVHLWLRQLSHPASYTDAAAFLSLWH